MNENDEYIRLHRIYNSKETELRRNMALYAACVAELRKHRENLKNSYEQYFLLARELAEFEPDIVKTRRDEINNLYNECVGMK